jgi:hypothetical protein
MSNNIKLSNGIFANINIRPGGQYESCQIKTSLIHKLPLILELYETIKEIHLIIDVPLPVWPQMTPHQMRLFHDIKTLIINSLVPTRMRPNMLPDNLWLIFPNLTQINSYETYIPPDNLLNLNLTVFKIAYKKIKPKTTKPQIQEIINAISQMTTLTIICISTDYPANITDELFSNNSGLTNVWINNIPMDNIPSITNCRELKVFKLIINILTNPYILELSNIINCTISFPNIKLGTQQVLPDDIFTKPLFTTTDIGLENMTNISINKEGINYRNFAEKYKLIEDHNDHTWVYFVRKN